MKLLRCFEEFHLSPLFFPFKLFSLYQFKLLFRLKKKSLIKSSFLFNFFLIGTVGQISHVEPLSPL